MLGFTCNGSLFPEIGENEEKILLRFRELYERKGDILEKLIEAAKKKMKFDEESVRFWASKIVGGAFGPLEPLLSDPDVEEIMVNGIGKDIFIYHRRKGMIDTGLKITSSDYFLELANRMLALLGRRVDESHPRANGVLKNGDRISVLIPPYARDFVLDIRRFSAEPFTILDLIDRGMLTTEAAAFLWVLMEAGNFNIGVVGNTGSGKTTLLNALLRFIPKHERIVLVEEVPEIRPLNDQVVRLISVEPLGLNMRTAIIDSMRLRPDRTVIGEVRSDEEVAALRESCLAGQALGTYFTYHAESAKQAVRRLISQGFPEHDINVIDLFVVTRRREIKGKIYRNVVEIATPSMVIFEREKELEMVAEFEMLEEMKKEMKKREKWLEKAERKRDKELFFEIQRMMGYV